MPVEVKRLLTLIFGGFILLGLALGVVQFAYGGILATDPRNPRLVVPVPATRRGGILARDGEVLSAGPGPMTRRYPVQSLCHTVGYTDPRFGASGLEAVFDSSLAGREPRSVWGTWLAELRGDWGRGADLSTTIDLRVQAAASGALGRRAGAVVVLDAESGDVLALVSQPGFHDPPTPESWAGDRARGDGPFLNRALQGLYPPGSSFKIVTAAAALNAGLGKLTTVCEGQTIIDGRQIKDAGTEGHGAVGLGQALSASCNVYFTRLGVRLGGDVLANQARAFGLGLRPPFVLTATAGSFPRPQTDVELAEASIGQGRVLVSPIQMALVAASVVNGGLLMRPRLVQSIQYWPSSSQDIKSRVWRRALRLEVAELLRQNLELAVTQGTGRRAAVKGWFVGGKTGTAQASGGRPHAWFVGFARSGQRKLAIAVVVEHAGSGGTVAAPVAAAVWRAAAGGATS